MTLNPSSSATSRSPQKSAPISVSFPKPVKAKRPGIIRRREIERRMIEWHNVVCERARCGDRYRCFHCHELFTREEVCGDHFPYGRGARPDLILDPTNGVCSCKKCNRSDDPDRAE